MDEQDRTTVRRFIFGAVVTILIVVLLWFIFFRDKDQKSNTQSTGSSTSQGQSTSSDKATTNPGSGTSTVAQAQVTPQKAGQLTNVGPGETTTVFITAAIMGAIGHHVYRKRFQTVRLLSGRQ